MSRPPLRATGAQLVALSGVWLVASGLGALAFAANGELLPHDVAFLGLTGAQLCALEGCRILRFMEHDRASFGGAVIAVGLLYVWVARGPLRRGERWAFFTLLGSGAVGFLSFLAYLQFGYLDLFHLWATVAAFLPYGLGMALSGPTVAGPPALRPAWGLDRLRLGRLLLCVAAGGMIAAGLTIAVLGSTVIFVPTDLEFIGAPASALAALNGRLLPLIAHDRAGFGGALCSVGVALLPTVLFGVRPGEGGLWWILCGVGLAGFGAAIGVHFIVGYLSVIHLLPAVAGAALYALGLGLLRGPMRGA